MDLVSIIRDLSRPLKPLATGVTPHLPVFPEIRAVAFDIYGTLVISGSGDISLANKDDKESQILETFEACGIQLAEDHPPIAPLFHDVIFQSHSESRAQGVAFPEVEIREVWAKLLWLLSLDSDTKGTERLAVEYQCRANPVWPMPALSETLSALRDAGMRLGIVSNSQFYTPLIFEALIGKTLESLGFDSNLLIWSYVEHCGKPSIHLYTRLAGTLLEQGMRPPEILFVGNDIRNDIWPAQSVGFRTALFAGDRRSLRMREKDPDCFDVTPDVVVTNLSQILEIVGVKTV